MTERNYYDILGLTPEADGTAVNRTYWLLARKYQGDATNDPRAHHLLDELNEAYGVLGTPVLREAYDAAHPFDDRSAASPAPEPSWAGVRETMRVPSAHHASETDRRSMKVNAMVPYAAMMALGAASIGAGIWSGSLLLAALGASALAAMSAMLMRHKIPALGGGIVSRSEEGTAKPASEPVSAPERTRATEALVGATILRRGGVPADELRLSTASMVGRWRVRTAAGSTDLVERNAGPDSTLVDIFRSEQEVEASSEPLSAVLDVLRGTHHTV